MGSRSRKNAHVSEDAPASGSAQYSIDPLYAHHDDIVSAGQDTGGLRVQVGQARANTLQTLSIAHHCHEQADPTFHPTFAIQAWSVGHETSIEKN